MSSSPSERPPSGQSLGGKSLLLGAALTGVLLAAVAAGGWWWAESRYHAHGTSSQTLRVRIAKGSGVVGITEALQQKGLLPGPLDPLIFRVMVKKNGLAAQLKAGEYDVPAGAGLDDLATMLASGRNLVQYPLTIPEGLTSPEVLALIRDMEPLEGEMSSSVATGDLLPETYSFLRGDPREAAIERMKSAMSKTLDELWEKRDPDLPFENKQQAVVLASMVEKETALASERPHVAAVFVNRLRLKMPLQSDPTVIYGLAPETGSLGRSLSKADLETDHPWNTYTRRGLPSSPIANPGRASLQAVMHPAKTKDLFFVADGKGGHAFSATLVDHNRNVRSWRQQKSP